MSFKRWLDESMQSRGSQDDMRPSETTMKRRREGLPTYSFNDRPGSRARKNCRNQAAHFFRPQYLYGTGMDRKTCIWSAHGDGDSWLDYSSGILWVGVHGSDSICVVTRAGILDIKRACSIMKPYTIESFLQKYRKTLIAEIDELADPYRGGIPYPEPPNFLRESAEKIIKKPFGIVSVGTNEVPKEFDVEAIEYDVKKGIKSIRERMESDVAFTKVETIQAIEYDVKKAIKSIRERMERDVAFTKDETIQAAISAFQHLFGNKFKANEIGVTVFDKANSNDGKELEIHDIEKHLVVVNEPGSGGSSSSSGHSSSSSSGRSTITSVELEDEE